MGQKINPIILRLGINKTWHTEFFETKTTELASYTLKNIEITEYIKKFLIKNNLILHSYKIHYNQSSINIYISYFIPISFKFNKNDFKNNKNLLTINKLNKELKISKFNEGLNEIGKKSIVVLREPSLGPVFGIKGGATGGGYWLCRSHTGRRSDGRSGCDLSLCVFKS